MNKKTNWEIEADNISMVIWRNVNDISLTIEIHILEDDDLDIEGIRWYVFPAKNGKGIPNSPEIFDNKEDAIEYAKSLMEA